MKRRNFGLLAATGMAALRLGPARAQTTQDASILQTILTPLGSERAGNADGTIPAWTGGETTVPDGWQPGRYMPDLHTGDALLVKIDASNMSQYADRLSPGTLELMTKYPDFYIKVYPTHRSAAAPQDVYDNIAANVTRAQLNAEPELGFTGAVGGIPFPILDTSDPLKAGAQCMWNMQVVWKGRAASLRTFEYAISGGQPYLSQEGFPTYYDYPYYRKGVTPANFDGVSVRAYAGTAAPPNNVGELYLTFDYTNPVQTIDMTWELLNGQGRVRKAPEVSYDTPASTVDGMADVDEFYGFAAQPDRYDWKYVGKAEFYIPYNNNAMFGLPAAQVIGAHFANPEMVRWELHRVHVVHADVRPGKRNTLAHRVLYYDEDTFQVAVTDSYDSNNTLVHVGLVYFMTRPDLPGTFIGNDSVHNLQTGDWAMMVGPFDEKEHPSLRFLDSEPNSMFTPANMAAQAQY